jgi:hypothetical protein
MALSMTDADSKRLLRSAGRELLDADELGVRKGPPNELAYLRVKLGVKHP